MIFILTFYADEQALAALSEVERNALVERHTAFREKAESMARVVDSRGIQPGHTAVTVRPEAGDWTERAGPAIEQAEGLGGFYLVDCPDRAAAVEVAKQYPMPEGLGCIEVRPVMADWDYAPSCDTNAPRAAVWQRYADLTTWPQWRYGVDAVALDGPFKAGASGLLTPVGREPVPFRIVVATEPASFVSEMDLVPGGTLREEHLLEELPGGGTRIVHRTTVPRAVLDAFGMDFAPALYEGMRRSVTALAEAAEAG